MLRERLHDYSATVTWIGPEAGSTETYAGYSREHTIAFEGKEALLRASADGAFRGDRSLLNPEELLVAALSSCHLLSYLALCARDGIEIVSYADRASGVMNETAGSGRFISATLRPHVCVGHAKDIERAHELHERAHAACFVANSVNFPVTNEPTVTALHE